MSQPDTLGAPSRGAWALRDRPALVWLIAAVMVALVHPFVPESRWLMVHLVLLGAITHSIMVWSAHFAQALLKTPPDLDDRRQQSRRLGLLLVGVTLVLVGVPLALWPVTVTGAVLVVAAVALHAGQLWRRLRAALPGRFRITVHYYLASAGCLPVGIALGVLLARGQPDPWHGRLLLAHMMVNVLGWIGFTVVGTLVTLWPTMLRTRMNQHAERFAIQALPVLVLAVTVITASALAGIRLGALAGILLYLAGLLWWGRALWSPARARPPREFASASVAAALMWWLTGLVWLTAALGRRASVDEMAIGIGSVVAVIVVGFAGQLLPGALSYLIPVVLGGGPAAARPVQRWLNRAGALRLIVINAGLALCLAPVPSAVRVAVSVLVLVALASFVPLVLLGIRAGVSAKRCLITAQLAAGTGAGARRAGAGTPAAATAPPAQLPAPFWRGGQLVGALSALAIAVTAGIGIDPVAAGLATTSPGTGEASAGVQPTGETTAVQVVADDMRFVPDRIEVPAGNRLVIDLVNEDPTNVHDLTLGGENSARLGHGETDQIVIDVVGASLEGWCTIIGHRQMGMAFHVDVVGGGAPGADVDAGGLRPHAEESGDPADAEVARPVISADAANLDGTVDAELPALGTERMHRLTLTAQEVTLEVAPGVWQRRWTFNGQVPGPTLHGRVGDTFEVTLVNDGSMGHSIDFHAGSLAPDEPMRTIAPGESLVYRFTAEKAGVWMYHCGTAPTSAHIAAGMFGAVVIEPEDLEPVDRSYLLVQSESYLDVSGERLECCSGDLPGPLAAREVDADRVLNENPDAVAFNGIAFQYQQQPLTAQVDERVRFWVLAAGPNRGTSFHIIGGQFDTVYHEGAYLLRDGLDAFGTTNGGSQALGLTPSQGGFVELSFPEVGHYPLVTHAMADAERGALGIVEVSD